MGALNQRSPPMAILKLLMLHPKPLRRVLFLMIIQAPATMMKMNNDLSIPPLVCRTRKHPTLHFYLVPSKRKGEAKNRRKI
jgi:hypothetical protein